MNSNEDETRRKEAEEQASLVGATIGKDLKSISVANDTNMKIKRG